MATTSDGRSLDISALEVWLWDAACAIRGPVDAPKVKDCILPLVFLKRLWRRYCRWRRRLCCSARPRKNGPRRTVS